MSWNSYWKSTLLVFIMIIAITTPGSFANDSEIQHTNIEINQSSDWHVVDFAGVADFRFWEIYGNNTESVIQQSINDTNRYLRNSGIPLSFRLTEVVIFTDANTANSTFTYEETNPGEVDPQKLLESFDSYVNNDPTLSTYEDAELYTGFDMTDNTFGIAYLGKNDISLSLEEAHKGIGVVQGTIEDIELIGVITAHH